MVVAVAAGNSGPGHYTVESPGSAARALTAGAASVGHFVAAPVTTGTVTRPGIAGDFGTVTSDLAAPLAPVAGGGANGLSTACSALPVDLSGKVAFLSRGTCSFSTKIRNAAAAGAAAVLMSNSVAGDAIAMGQDGTANQPTIPAYMVSLTDTAALLAAAGPAVTIGAGAQYFVTGNDDIMASFSSEGPTDVDFRVKPDVVAPGVNVLSSIPHQFCAAPPCFAFFQGTSMATPHLAGSAAVVRWQHPGWTAAQIRSAIVNTADQGKLRTSNAVTLASDVQLIGAGREDLLSAVLAPVALDPVSVSFGSVPSGSGQTRTATVTVTNLGGASLTGLAVTVGAGDASVVFGVSPIAASLAPGESTTVAVTLSSAKGAAGGDHQAKLAVSASGTELAHAAVYAFVK
jgi:subtilisin family serine protease